MKHEEKWWFRVNGKTFDEWLASRRREPLARPAPCARVRPRIVCWRDPATREQREHTRRTGEVRFVPASGPAWQGRRGRRPSQKITPAATKANDLVMEEQR